MVPESCRILRKNFIEKCFLPPQTLPAVFFDAQNLIASLTKKKNKRLSTSQILLFSKDETLEGNI